MLLRIDELLLTNHQSLFTNHSSLPSTKSTAHADCLWKTCRYLWITVYNFVGFRLILKNIVV